MAELIINGVAYPFSEGNTILDVARRNDVHIPTMCYLKEITPIGACRLCLVEVDGVEKPVAACVTYAKDGMKVTTDTPAVVKHRKMMLDFILIKHPLDCPVCDKAGECDLQDTAMELGMKGEVVSSRKPDAPVKEWNKIVYNENLCVLCERCVKSCHEITGCSALAMEDRGFNNHIVPAEGELSCDFCGICVDNCPVGALLDKETHHSFRAWDLENVTSTCTICPVGCTAEYGVLDGKIVRARSSEESHVCALGRGAWRAVYADSRLTAPKMNVDGKKGTATWDEVEKFMQGKAGSVDSSSVAFVLGSRMTNEAVGAYRNLADRLGTKKVITELELMNGSFYKAYKEKFGTLENIGTLGDIATSDLVMVVGADLADETVGVKWRMMDAVVNNDARLVTIGLTKYEYDFFTDVSLVANYGNFAGKLEHVKLEDEEPGKTVAEYIKNAKKVSIIVGNEYLMAESQQDAILAFADTVGKEKLGAFFVLNDKGNAMGLRAMDMVAGDYTADAFTKDLAGGKIGMLVSVGFNPQPVNDAMKAVADNMEKAGLTVAVDLFETSATKKANIALPAKASLEMRGTVTTIDSRIATLTPAIEPPELAKNDPAIAAMIGKALGIDGLKDCVSCSWDEYVKGKNGYPNVVFDELDGALYKTKDTAFNATSFSFKKPKHDTKIVPVNARYHRGSFSVQAAITVKGDGGTRSYYFDAGMKPVAGPEAKYDGDAVVDETVAKAIVMVPKNQI